MSTVTSLARAVGGVGNPSRKAYFVQQEVDFAAAATAKGTALAAADIIETISVPAGSMVVNAGIQVVEAAVGGTGTTLDLGVTGVDADVFVDGFTFDGAAAAAYAQNAAAFQPVVLGAADTIDVLVQAGSTVSISGKIRVWAILMDVSDVGDTAAAEVDRDQLA